MTSRRAAWLSAAALALAAAALLAPALRPGMGLSPADALFAYPPWQDPARTASNALLADQYLVFAPIREFLHREWGRGRFPLWNPFLACGVPALASMQAAALFPLNLVYAVLEPFRAGVWAAFLKLFLAGLFTAAYLRRLGAGWAAATLSGLAFSLCGFMVVWLGAPQANAAALLPALFLCVEPPAGKAVLPGRLALLSLCFASLFLSGHPPTVLHAGVAVAAYLGFLLWPRARGPESSSAAAPGRCAALFLGAVALGLCLAAPQLLPYLEYWRESSAPQMASALHRGSFHLPVRALVHFLLPLSAGSPAAGFDALERVWGYGFTQNFSERTGFFGVVPLGLALVAVLGGRERPVRFHACAAAAALAAVFGLPPLPWILGALPVLKDINHERLLVVVCFSGAVLAGLGLDSVLKGRRPSRRDAAVLAAVAAAALLSALAILRPVLAIPELEGFLLRQALAFLGGCAALAAVLAGRGLSPGLRGGVALAAAALELVWFGFGYNPAVKRADYYPETPALAFLKANAGTDRILGLGPALPPNAAAVHGLYDLRGVDGMSLRRYEELVSGRAGDPWFYCEARGLPQASGVLRPGWLVLPPRGPDADDAPPGFSSAYEGEAVVLRAEPRPARAFIAHEARRAHPSEALSLLRSGGADPERAVLLDENAPDPLPEASGAAAGGGPEAASIASYEPDEVVVKVSAARAGWLVLLDSWFPGWKAFVDGRPAPVLRALYAFRAVPIAANSREVRFVYRPASFRWGLALAGLAGLLLTAALALGARVPGILRS